LDKALKIAAKNISKFPGIKPISIEGFSCTHGFNSVLSASRNGGPAEAHLADPCPRFTDQRETAVPTP